MNTCKNKTCIGDVELMRKKNCELCDIYRAEQRHQAAPEDDVGLNNLLNANKQLERKNYTLTKMLTKLANNHMDRAEDGSFIKHPYSSEVTNLLGI